MAEKDQTYTVAKHDSHLKPHRNGGGKGLDGKRSLSFVGNDRHNVDTVNSDLEQDELEKGQANDTDAKSMRSNRSGKSGKSANSRKTGKSAGGQSFGSDNSSTTGGHGKTVADTTVAKLFRMASAFFSLVLHILYLIGLIILGSPNGMVLPFNKEVFSEAGPVIALVWARVCYLTCDQALNDGFGAFVGYLLSRKEGYSVAACGFVQSSLGEKLTFSNRLSFRSTAKPLLSKASLIWVAHYLNLILGIIAATSISTTSSQIDSTSLMCIEYSQQGVPNDRGIPTIRNEMGGAELIDGTAFGTLRVHDPELPHTTHIFPPQLIDACQDGSCIKGPGFATDISTTCDCVDDIDVSLLEVSGVPSSISSVMSARATQMQNFQGWVNYVHPNSTSNITTVYTILTGTSTCGGVSPLSASVNSSDTASVAVCTTRISNHRHAFVKVTYKTDGTPASIACRLVELLEEKEPANMDWLTESINSFLEIESNQISSQLLPSHWPGSSNPFFWFSSSNMQDASLGLLEPGIEAAMALVVRGSIQRSYSTAGSFCTQQVIDPDNVTLKMEGYGYTCGVIWIVLQLILNCFILVLYLPWWLYSYPMITAVDVAQDNIIFSLLASKNAPTMNRIKSMSANIENGLIWPRLDLVLRVGESVQTSDDPERGVVVMEKPRLVVPLSFDKVYI